ncbi:hypothetical protein RIF29_08046 [Crotalaria pallida]|uniref:Uncharacterized protein n=1 Tax=Crotalaria pallida TaxID=3830 RepID=A0AAN9J510_CROPI
MASVNFSLFAPSYTNISIFTTPRTTPHLFIASSFPSPKKSPTYRKNHLRPKILKTLIPKPYSPPSLPLLPPQQQHHSPLLVFDIPSAAVEESVVIFQDSKLPESEATPTIQFSGEVQDLRVSDSVATTHCNSVSPGNFYADAFLTFFKYGVIFMVVNFLLNCICYFFVNDDGTVKRRLQFKNGKLELLDSGQNSNLSSYNSNLKNRDLEIAGRGREKWNLLLNAVAKAMPVNNAAATESVVDPLEKEKKIQEIKLMAREARRLEEMKKERGEVEEPDFDDESPLSSPRLVIEREIGARLSKLQNRIINNKDSSAALQVINSIGHSVKCAGGVAKDANKNVNQGNETLTFRKKLKFKSPSTKPKKTPKGFPGTRRESGAKKRDSAGMGAAKDYGSDVTDAAHILYEDKLVNQQDVKKQERVSRLPLEGKKLVDDKSNAILNHGSNLEKEMETLDLKTGAGVKTKNTNNGEIQETSFGKSAHEVIQSRESRTENSQGSLEENQDTDPINEKDDMQDINGSSRLDLAKKTSAANSVKVKQANTKTDVWWLNLRFVLVILMQRGPDGGQKALYKLNLSSEEHDQGVDSYIVAFEDHGDANNFSVLLESFFEDLDDFVAYPVPMTIKELNKEITSHAKKVVVVKKRQLQLYAGQPLTDAEMALRSLIEQDQNVP